MRCLLHILTTPDDTLAQEIISIQRQQTDLEVTLVDVNAAEPDYHALLEKIFVADSIQVW